MHYKPHITRHLDNGQSYTLACGITIAHGYFSPYGTNGYGKETFGYAADGKILFLASEYLLALFMHKLTKAELQALCNQAFVPKLRDALLQALPTQSACIGVTVNTDFPYAIFSFVPKRTAIKLRRVVGYKHMHHGGEKVQQWLGSKHFVTI